MANGFGGFEPTWWQALLGGLGTLLLGWAGGQRRGHSHALEEDHARAVVAVEISRDELRAQHEETREAVHELMTLIRNEGRDTRGAIYSLGQTITAQIGQLHRDMLIEARGRNGAGKGNG